MKTSIIALALLALASTAQAESVVTADRYLDVESGRYVEHPAIFVDDDGKITSIADARTVRWASTVKHVDLGGHTLLPGFIDMHVHLDGRPEYGGYNSLQFTDRFWSAVAVGNAAKMLKAGFTTVRNLGDSDFNVAGLDQAIGEGWVIGPRIVNANFALGATGGHCDETFLPPSFERKGRGVGDTPEELRQKVRETRKYGAEVIKACATGGVFSRNTAPGIQQLSLEELTAIANEAHFWGLKAAAHAHGADGIKAAIRAGFDTIEHASYIDDEGIRLARERGTFLSMDVFNTEYTLTEGARNGVLEENIAKERALSKIQRDNFAKAHKAGVKMVFGTDAGVMPHETAGGQFAVMVRLGMTPLEAVRAATLNAAEALGQKGQVGVLKTGAWADMVAIKGDPLADVSKLAAVDAVVKGGERVE